MVEIDESEIEEFAHQMIESYNEKSLISNIFNSRPYDEEMDEGLEFRQVGKKLRDLPKRFFSKEGVYSNRQLARDFADAIRIGERNYVLKRLRGLSEEDQINTTEMDEISLGELSEAAFEVNNPTDVFVPVRKELHHKILDIHSNYAEAGQTETMLPFAPEGTKVHWLPQRDEDENFERMFVVNRNRINFIQKSISDKEGSDVDNFIEEYQDLIYDEDSDEKLIMYFGDNSESEFYFSFKTIFYMKKPAKNAAAVVELPENLSDES